MPETHSAPVPPARVIHAVNAALQRDLAVSGSDPESVEHLLMVCDVLMHRAVLDETREARRSRAAARLTDLAAALVDRSTGGDVYRKIEEASPAVAASTEAARTLDRILQALAETDLP